MHPHPTHKPQRSGHDVDVDDPEPGQLPVDPDHGPVTPAVPADPEHDRLVDPAA